MGRAFRCQYMKKGKLHRGKRAIGEWFIIDFAGIGEVIGRVIRNDCATRLPETTVHTLDRTDVHLIYLYQRDVTRQSVDGLVTPSLLLGKPLRVNQSGWERGYFRPFCTRALHASEILAVHCCGWDRPNHQLAPPYCDEYGNPLLARTEPCISYGVGAYGYVENEIARHYGLPTNYT
jgi:hypothetical protein